MGGWCLLFGALISPTDPIAVLAILKSANAQRSLAAKMAGESLLNDGFGIMLFVLFLGIVLGGEEASFASVSLLFAREVLGGALFGLAIGYAAYRLLDALDSYEVEILLTLALVMRPAPGLPARRGRHPHLGRLRGGISVALALALPAGAFRDAIITVTYVVVLFSILVQGLMLSRLLRRRAA